MKAFLATSSLLGITYALAVLLPIYLALGCPFAQAKPLVPEGCYLAGCHGGSLEALWYQHTWDKRAVEKFGIQTGDCLRCHITQEELDEHYMNHYKSWYWYEREQAKAEQQPWVRIPTLSPWVALALAGWILVAGVVALAKKRWA